VSKNSKQYRREYEMRNRRLSLVHILAVAALCFAVASARAADPDSPVDAAHVVLRALIGKRIAAGNPEKSHYYNSYRGRRCHSTFEIGQEVRDID
jgi:hypothetical protein